MPARTIFGVKTRCLISLGCFALNAKKAAHKLGALDLIIPEHLFQADGKRLERAFRSQTPVACDQRGIWRLDLGVRCTHHARARRVPSDACVPMQGDTGAEPG